MRNLHLMQASAHFNKCMIFEINKLAPPEDNVFVLRERWGDLSETVENVRVDPNCFSAKYINQHCEEYDQIIIHFLWMHDFEIAKLSDTAARRIIWIVWGNDLYPMKPVISIPGSARSAISLAGRLYRYYGISYKLFTALARKKVEEFRTIGVGFHYDKVEVRRRFGNSVPVKFGPVFSIPGGGYPVKQMREKHLNKSSSALQILVGHNGFAYQRHEEILHRLKKYRDEDIHINLVLNYGTDEKQKNHLIQLAHSLFGKEKCTILTERLSVEDYYDFLTQIDIGIFTFQQQGGLGNVRRLAYMGSKLYLNQNGALAKGFLTGGMPTFDYEDIGRIDFEELKKMPVPPDPNIELFKVFDHQYCIDAWKELLGSK